MTVAGGAEQLPLDFSASVSQRLSRARKAAVEQPSMFAYVANIDVHLRSPRTAVADVAGVEPERARPWLERIVGPVQAQSTRRLQFPSSALDRLLYVAPPAQVTLDASCVAVARALWAHRLGLRPLRVTRHRSRLLASSPRWPTVLKVVDAPWPAIAALAALGVPFDTDPRARGLLAERLGSAGTHIARAGLAGSAVVLEASRPDLLEALGLPALAYHGEQGTGNYRMPLLCASCLLDEPSIDCSEDLVAAIRKANRKPRPLATRPDFPWELYPFQARDAASAERILATTGGVLLAGTMGSGKTTVSLALVDDLDLWPLLVVAPLAAFSTWQRQLGEMGRSAYLATEAPAVSWDTISNGDHDAVVLSYDRLHAFVELVEAKGFAAIVADELQRIRTPSSRRSRALRTLAYSVPIRIGLSGTPISNRIEELLPLGSFLVPGEWRPRASARDLAKMFPGDHVEALTDHLGAMMVRRRMEDTGAKLPNRHDHRVLVQLTPEQRRALNDLAAEAERAKSEEGFTHLHAFVRLHRMRAIVACPATAGVAGPNPKLSAAIELAEDFIAQGRKGVLFCADRQMFRDLSAALDSAGIGHVGIWGSTPINERIAAEKEFHANPDKKIVLATIQAASESVTFSPTATFLICTSYVYSPATLDQMEARIYRLNQTNEVDICYLHATAPGGTLDDRIVEILTGKRQLISSVVDRIEHVDNTKVHYSLSDLVYLLTGTRDEALEAREADSQAVIDAELAAKAHARATIHRRRTGEFLDDGSVALTKETYARLADEGLDAALDDPALDISDLDLDDFDEDLFDTGELGDPSDFLEAST